MGLNLRLLIYTNKLSDEEKFQNCFKIYENSQNNGLIEFNIRFAWEEEPFYESNIAQMLNAIKEVEVMVIIGYSFPVFNRDVDKRIFASMKNLTKIYLQDSINYIPSRVLPLLPKENFIKRHENEFNNDLNQFLIPPEL